MFWKLIKLFETGILLDRLWCSDPALNISVIVALELSISSTQHGGLLNKKSKKHN